MIYAIIVAAGRGVRMQAAQRKQFLNIGGRPILLRTLQVFDRCRSVERLLVVVPSDDMEFCREHILAAAELKTEIQLVAGGAQRQDSVRNGLDAILEEEGIVLIHDGVRPLVTQALVEACIQGARQWGACVPAVTAVDTPKLVKHAVIQNTIPRDSLQLAQTPQAFKLSLIRHAHQDAKLNKWLVTDDAAIVERLGGRVHIIPGLRENIKLTTPQDLGLAEYYITCRDQKD
ncbi:MAG: 2-C-methyl-D-erythritol 4-phosphate cytidylyltransferase [Desulfobacteraceae bacterium]